MCQVFFIDFYNFLRSKYDKTTTNYRQKQGFRVILFDIVSVLVGSTRRKILTLITRNSEAPIWYIPRYERSNIGSRLWETISALQYETRIEQWPILAHLRDKFWGFYLIFLPSSFPNKDRSPTPFLQFSCRIWAHKLRVMHGLALRWGRMGAAGPPRREAGCSATRGCLPYEEIRLHQIPDVPGDIPCKSWAIASEKWDWEIIPRFRRFCRWKSRNFIHAEVVFYSCWQYLWHTIFWSK